MSYGVMRMGVSSGATWASKSPQEARRHVLSLYAQARRLVPVVLRAYDMPHDPQSVRTAYYNTRQRFEAYRHVKDIANIDALRYKGLMEVQEATHLYLTKSHVGQLLKEAKVDLKTKTVTKRDGPSEFLLGFLQGNN